MANSYVYYSRLLFAVFGDRRFSNFKLPLSLNKQWAERGEKPFSLAPATTFELQEA
jgi:hypothetical protein